MSDHYGTVTQAARRANGGTGLFPCGDGLAFTDLWFGIFAHRFVPFVGYSAATTEGKLCLRTPTVFVRCCSSSARRAQETACRTGTLGSLKIMVNVF